MYINRQCQTFTSEKNSRSKKLPEKLISYKGNAKKFQDIFGGRFILTLLSSAVFLLQHHVSDFFNFILLERQKAFKGFQGHNERFPHYLG